MFVKGLNGAADYWRKHQDFEMIIVTEDGQVYLTEGVEDRFSLGSSFSNLDLNVIRAEG